MGRLANLMAQIEREKEAKQWRHDLMHYINDTGKYAERKRQMLRTYHPKREYRGEVGFDSNGNPFCRYWLLPTKEEILKTNTKYWMQLCGCRECKRFSPCPWVKVSLACHGED